MASSPKQADARSPPPPALPPMYHRTARGMGGAACPSRDLRSRLPAEPAVALRLVVPNAGPSKIHALEKHPRERDTPKEQRERRGGVCHRRVHSPCFMRRRGWASVQRGWPKPERVVLPE